MYLKINVFVLCMKHALVIIINNNNLITFNILGVKYFGVIKYFFRLDYTNAVQSIPICAVEWIQFNVVKDTINCVIGQIPMQSWHELMPHPILKNKPFISFNDLQPSRFALSYIPNPNRRSYWMEVAFMALDSEKLGEHVDAAFYNDFGDNIFPPFKGNRKTKSVFEEQDKSDDEGEEESSKRLSSLKEFIPQSIIDFILE
jgi:hypothetical protein